jgi:hypothetical protein
VHTEQEPISSENVAFMYQPDDFADLGQGTLTAKVVWTGRSSIKLTVSGPINSPDLQALGA